MVKLLHFICIQSQSQEANRQMVSLQKTVSQVAHSYSRYLCAYSYDSLLIEAATTMSSSATKAGVAHTHTHTHKSTELVRA